jgi:hypothetical protein
LERASIYVRRDRDDTTVRRWALVEQGAPRDVPSFDPLGPDDDFKIAARLARDVPWYLIWIDTRGEVFIVERGTSRDAIYPAQERRFVAIDEQDPPGLHLLYLVVDPGGVLATTGMLAQSLDAVGPPPGVTGRIYAAHRGPGSVRVSGSVAIEAYLRSVDEQLPEGVEPVWALGVPGSTERRSAHPEAEG